MSAESGWAVAVGAAVGILSWVVGLGNLVWPKHPQWALFLITVSVTLVSMLVLERNGSHRTKLVQP